MTPTALLARGLLACTIAVAAACSGFHSDRGATQVYTLVAPPAPQPARAPQPSQPPAPQPPAINAAVGGADHAPTLQVLRPLAAPGLDTDRIALLRPAQRLDYYAASRWPAPLPQLLQSLAVDALRASGRFGAVLPDATPFSAEVALQLEIGRCEAEYAAGGPPVVHVELRATLGRQGDRSLLATAAAASARPAAANTMQAVIAAFQQAVGEALTQLAAQLPVPAAVQPAP